MAVLILALEFLSAEVGAAGPDPTVRILHDLVSRFPSATVDNAVEASAGDRQRSGGVALPGIFLHPSSRGDAVVAFAELDLPEAGDGGTVLLVFRPGLRDGLPRDAFETGANGVRFSVRVEDRTVFEEHIAESGWKARAIDLSPWAGRAISLELRTGAVDGNSSYDWAVFAQPLVVGFTWSGAQPPLEPDAVGLGMARIICETPAEVEVTFGDAATTARLSAGVHLLPLHFRRVGAPGFRQIDGTARLHAFRAARFPSGVQVKEFGLSSPLVEVGRPFRAVLHVRNEGPGRVPPDSKLEIRWELSPSQGPGRTGIDALTIPPLGPGDAELLCGKPLVADGPGTFFASVVGTSLRTHVFPPLTEHTERESRGPSGQSPPLLATVESGPARVRVFLDPGGAACAVAEIDTPSGWRRLGSLYPLAELVVRLPDGASRSLPVRFDRLQGRHRGLEIVGRAGPPSLDGGPPPDWTVRVLLEAQEDTPRIAIRTEATASTAGDLLAFRGPTVLAGDRAYGAAKDFALFPGLEYLTRDEASSSERDLAYPLSDRRVPAAYRITTPLMAVQEGGGLIALLWDARQEWAPGERTPAARFLAPPPGRGSEHVHMSLFAPSVGKYVEENRDVAFLPYPASKGTTLRLESMLVLDSASRYGADGVVNGPHRGGLVLQAMRHWFEVYGLPEPSPMPRSWEEEKALCLDAYLGPLWREEPPGWAHCVGWEPGLLVGHAVPLSLLASDGVPGARAREIRRRADRIVAHAERQLGPGRLWLRSGCHIVLGELPYRQGRLAESMIDLRENARRVLDARENGLWVWRPGSRRHASLGRSGDHTLGQAALNAFTVLRAARLGADLVLGEEALDAMRQLELYEVPRGAQMWECPLYQPDILAAAYAIRAYCEAFRLTGERSHLNGARYWAWTGLPFLYTRDREGYPTMLFNVVSVIGSTFHEHSWLGLPVVWCGLVYAYALLELAEHDRSFEWERVARGIVRSAMWQQYTEGPSRGCYPDSWDMVRNAPNPADINPENIVMVASRLRGRSAEIRTRRLADGGKTVLLNSAADILAARGGPATGRVEFRLGGFAAGAAHSLIAPVPRPRSVLREGRELPELSSDALQEAPEGWLWSPELRAAVLKSNLQTGPISHEIRW